MTINTNITLIIFSLVLIIVITIVLKRGYLAVKYSLLWYAISIVVLFPVFFPAAFSWIGHKLGFETIASLMIGIILGLLTLMTIVLSIICSKHRKRITLLIQEVSLLKKAISSNQMEEINDK